MKRTMHRAFFAAAIPAAVIVLAVSGCRTVPEPSSIPLETSVLDLSQKGQESIDVNNYKAAEVYYQLIIDRYGNDPAALTSAEFEIAHMRFKKKKYAEARPMYERIIARYAAEGGAQLPPKYLVLARNDLARIPTKAEKTAEATNPAQPTETAPTITP